MGGLRSFHPAHLDPPVGRLPRDDQRVVVLFMGGPEARRKGLQDVLAVVENVACQAPRVEFHVIADPEDVWAGVPEAFRHRVRVDSSVRGPAKFAAFAEADIFVLPSYAEGFPNTLLEAMAAGLAVVVTPVGAVPEVVREP
jgi:glycosyltransferase involved in cell wall biosynthesis